MPRSRILIVDADRELTRVLTGVFTNAGYDVTLSHDGREGLREVRFARPDVMLLDLDLPGLSRRDVCNALRAGDHTRYLPLIVTSAKADEIDQLIGYSLGADDYMNKPFSNRVLLAKVKALLRRTARPVPPDTSSEVTAHEGISIDRARWRATFEGRPLDLTSTEFRLLEILVLNPGRECYRWELVAAIIGVVVERRTINVHINKLRRKLARAGGTDDLIEACPGVGYRLRNGKVASH